VLVTVRATVVSVLLTLAGTVEDYSDIQTQELINRFRQVLLCFVSDDCSLELRLHSGSVQAEAIATIIEKQDTTVTLNQTLAKANTLRTSSIIELSSALDVTVQQPASVAVYTNVAVTLAVAPPPPPPPQSPMDFAAMEPPETDDGIVLQSGTVAALVIGVLGMLLCGAMSVILFKRLGQRRILKQGSLDRISLVDGEKPRDRASSYSNCREPASLPPGLPSLPSLSPSMLHPPSNTGAKTTSVI